MTKEYTEKQFQEDLLTIGEMDFIRFGYEFPSRDIDDFYRYHERRAERNIAVGLTTYTENENGESVVLSGDTAMILNPELQQLRNEIFRLGEELYSLKENRQPNDVTMDRMIKRHEENIVEKEKRFNELREKFWEEDYDATMDAARRKLFEAGKTHGRDELLLHEFVKNFYSKVLETVTTKESEEQKFRRVGLKKGNPQAITTLLSDTRIQNLYIGLAMQISDFMEAHSVQFPGRDERTVIVRHIYTEEGTCVCGKTFDEEGNEIIIGYQEYAWALGVPDDPLLGPVRNELETSFKELGSECRHSQEYNWKDREYRAAICIRKNCDPLSDAMIKKLAEHGTVKTARSFVDTLLKILGISKAGRHPKNNRF